MLLPRSRARAQRRLASRKNFERESRGPAVKVDALLVLVADWALRAGGLHEGAVLLGEDNVLLGVLENDLGPEINVVGSEGFV